jgi:acyl-CoA synthetase (NDP forming)
LPEAEALAVLDAYGLPLLKSTHIHTVAEAHALAESVNYPVALKIISKDIVHKTDVGGVKLHVAPHDIPASYEAMLQVVSQKAPHAHLDGVLAMEMAPKDGFEFVIGVNKDPALGHMVMVGLGGVFVEVLKDVAFRLAPLTAQDVDEMLREVKASKLLEGVRGMDPLDRAALTECLLRISQLVTDFPEIQELDINPILVLPKEQGVRVLDGRIIIANNA